jgi:hypothetical protein
MKKKASQMPYYGMHQQLFKSHQEVWSMFTWEASLGAFELAYFAAC